MYSLRSKIIFLTLIQIDTKANTKLRHLFWNGRSTIQFGEYMQKCEGTGRQDQIMLVRACRGRVMSAPRTVCSRHDSEFINNSYLFWTRLSSSTCDSRHLDMTLTEV